MYSSIEIGTHAAYRLNCSLGVVHMSSSVGSSSGDSKTSSEERCQSERGRVAQVSELLRWVQSHPVLATVIWVFGKVVEGTHSGNISGPPLIQDNSSMESKSPVKKVSSRRLSWNDEHGGSLAEYYIDSRASGDANDGETDEPLMRLDGRNMKCGLQAYSTEPEGVHLRSKLNYNHEFGNCKSHSPDQNVEQCEFPRPSGFTNIMMSQSTAISPQWGWYVALTPPQDHFPGNPFPTGLKDIANSENASEDA